MPVLLGVEHLLISIMILCHNTWTENESFQSSTWRELSVIEFALQSFASVLEGSHVKWFTDSQAAAKIVEVGSMKLGLHKMARRIFDICIRSGIHLEVQWIPRTMNQQADYISRFIDTDDWQLTDEFFLFLDGCWGPHSVDCFANYYNHKLPKYFSRFWNPNTWGVDFFLSASSRRELPGGSSCRYCSACFALYEMPACCGYTRRTPLAFGSFLAFNYEQI